MFSVTKTTCDSLHITFSTNCASVGFAGRTPELRQHLPLASASVVPGFGKNRSRTAASSFSGTPL